MTGARPPFIRHGTPLFRRTNSALFAAGAATFGMLYCVQPLMPQFSRHFALSAAAGSLALSVSTGVMAVSLLFASAVSDRLGRKPVMIISLWSSSALTLLAALAPDWASLLGLRALLGLALSGLPAVAMTYLSEEVEVESLGLGMGLYISGSALGGMGGRLVVSVLTEYAGWRVALAAMGAFGCAASWLFTRGLPASRHFSPRPLALGAHWRRCARAWADAGLPWLFAVGFVLLGSFVTLYNYIGFRLLQPPYGLSQSAVGLLFAVYLVGTFSSTWIGGLAGRLGRRRVLWSMFLVMAAGLAMTLAASLWAIIGGLAVFTFGFFGGHSIASSWVGRRAGDGKAQASALYLFAYYLGSSLAGYAGGLFYAARGWPGVALFLAALLAVGMLAALRLYRLSPLPPAASPAGAPML